jgi:glucokinase
MYAIGVDIGGSNLRAALVHLQADSWQIEEHRRLSLPSQISAEALVQQLADILASFPSTTKDAAIGVGIAAMLRGNEGIIDNAPNLGWRNVDFGSLLRQGLGRHVWLENDLSAICWGEFRFGAAKEYDSAVSVFVGTGVGGGVVTDGKLYRGVGNAAMEIGHLRIQLDGKRCGCGARGCVEAYAGGHHLAEAARKSSSQQMVELCADPQERHAGHLEQAALAGDGQAVAVLDQAVQALGWGLSSALTLFNPDCLVLGGTVWDGVEWLRKGVLRSIDELTNPPARGGVTILSPLLGDQAGVLGAADLALRNSSPVQSVPQ